MLVLMTVAVILFYAGLFRYAGKDNRSRGSSSPAEGPRVRIDSADVPVGEDPVADAVAMRLTWTALDDLQLNRLLRESS